MRKPVRPEFLLVVLALLVSGLLVSQARKETPSQQPPQVEEQRGVRSSGSPAPFDEKEYLRSQLAEMHDYDQRLLATVYWSLGGVFLVVVVIAGLNWFANYRIYEREKESLRNEVNMQVKALQSELEQRFHKLSQSLGAAGQRQAEELQRQLSSEVKKSIAAENENHRRQILSLQRQLSQALFEDTAFRAEYYESQNKGYQAFGLWVDNLEHMKKVGMWQDSFIAAVLKKLVAILEKGQIISYGFQEQLTRLLEAAPPVLGGDVQRLRTLMNAAPKV